MGGVVGEEELESADSDSTIGASKHPFLSQLGFRACLDTLFLSFLLY